MKKLRDGELVSIPFSVGGCTYYADIEIASIVNTYKGGGDTAVENLIEEAVYEKFHQNIAPSFDSYTFMEELQENYKIDLGV